MQLYVLLSRYLCFISYLYLDLYVPASADPEGEEAGGPDPPENHKFYGFL